MMLIAYFFLLATRWSRLAANATPLPAERVPADARVPTLARSVLGANFITGAAGCDRHRWILHRPGAQPIFFRTADLVRVADPVRNGAGDATVAAWCCCSVTREGAVRRWGRGRRPPSTTSFARC
jgi:hypothetical protein